MKNWSLGRRIAIWSALVSTLALLTFTATIAVNLYSEQVEAIDGQLETARQLAFGEQPAVDRATLGALGSMLIKPPRSHKGSPLRGFAILRTTDHTLVQAQPATLAQAVPSWPLRKKHFTATLEGARLRIASFPLGDATLLLAASLEPAEESVHDLFSAAALALPLVLLVVTGGSWWIARRALAPIADITRTTASITADRLGERLPAALTTDEIGRHTDVLNSMFDRLQRSFEQATRFTADAAHELRTPLTIMRGQVEDALHSATAGQEPLLIGLLEEITGLQKISDNLLLLARFDAGKSPLQRAPLDLSALLEEIREDAELLAMPHNLKISAQIETAICVSGDAVMLRRVALNLVNNAVKFNRTAGDVKLTLQTDGRGAHFTIGNTGRGIPAEQRATLFERFYRSDADRNRNSGGSGLGLSLCREIVTAHAGRIELSRAEEDWTEFTVFLPGLVSSA